MPIKIRHTSEVAQDGVKILVYGQSGVGKTRLISTLPKPIILSAESGELTLSDCDIPFIEIKTLGDLEDAHEWLKSSDEAKMYHSIAIDSISEIGDIVLGVEKKLTKDGRMAYGAMADKISELVRKFRDIKGYNVYMSAKLDRIQDEANRMLYGPSMPGSKTGASLPYQFDVVAALRHIPNDDGTTSRMLMCDGDANWTAKSRIAGVDAFEEPDLGAIIRKASQVMSVGEAEKMIRSSKDIDDLLDKWISLSPDMRKAIVSVKDEVKAALMEVQGDE